jgi:hypothetical protein
MLILVKDMIMQFIQYKASRDISSSTYECKYVNEVIAWITLNKADNLGYILLNLVIDMIM